MERYHKLAEVRFFHKYYDTFSSKDFLIQPSPDTVSLLTSYGVIFKQTPEGLILLFKERNQLLFEKLKTEIVFRFGIKVKNKYFETFSNVLPASEKRKYLFANQAEISEQHSEWDQKYLHPEGFINKNNVCLCGYRSVVMNELLEVPEVLIKQGDQTVFEGELNHSHTFSRIFGDEYGLYSVAGTDSEPTELLYLPDSLRRAFGVIEIAVGGENTAFENMRGQEYHINFDSRQTEWNYYFVCQPDQVYDAVEVFLGKKKLPFSDPEQVTLINGQQALKVASQENFKLKNRYNGDTFTAELKSTAEGDSATKKVNLVTPDVTRIKGRVENNAEIYFSEMYIYL